MQDRSYAKSWAHYIQGNVMSQTSQRFITNLLTSTAARVVEEPGDSSEDTDEIDDSPVRMPAGNMDLIRQTLDGVSSMEKGYEAIGRHAAVIQLGRNVWQSPPLTAAEADAVRETRFYDDTFPPASEVLKAAQEAVKK